jgi:hypothetical protein
MHATSSNLTLFGCFLFLVACVSGSESTPLASDFSRDSHVTSSSASAEDDDKREFQRLVENLGVAKFAERSITTFENSAKCPFRALTFDGLTHVVCDFSGCPGRVCSRDCRQAYAYLNLSTLNVTTQEPLVDYRKVYMGCIFEDRNGIESPEEPKLV